MADRSGQKLISEVKRIEKCAIVVLSGEVDLHQSPALHAELLEIAKDRPEKFILDLREVGYIDSSGVGTFVDVFRRVNGYKGKMVLVGLNDRVRSVFEITKLDRFFTICDTEEEALSG